MTKCAVYNVWLAPIDMLNTKKKWYAAYKVWLNVLYIIHD